MATQPSQRLIAQTSEPAAPFWLRPAQVFEHLNVGKNVKATRQWLRDHGIVPRNDGKFSRREINRELNRPRRHRVHANSLANLRQRA